MSNEKIINQNFEPMKIIMSRNLEWRIKLFKNKYAYNLFKKIIQEYVKFSQKENFKTNFCIFTTKR